MGTELEAKYVVPDRALFRRLAKLNQVGAYRLCPLGVRQVVDYYLDTADRALAVQGWACRLRLQDNAWSLTLKSAATVEGAIQSRAEFEVPLDRLPRSMADWPPGEIRSRVEALCRGGKLASLLTIRQRRHVFAVLLDEVPVAELSLDRVRTLVADVRHRSLLLECELAQGAEAWHLERLARLLVSTYGLRPARGSKLHRGLELLLGAAPAEGSDSKPSSPGTRRTEDTMSEITLADTMSVAAAKIIGLHLERMLAHEEGTRLGVDPEELHDMRVATRRMRSAFRLLGPYLHSPLVEPCAEGLRTCARILGAVRDMDVILQETAAYLAEQDELDESNLAPLLAQWTERRIRGREALLAYLDSPAYAELVGQLRALVDELASPSSERQAGSTVRDVVPRVLYLRWQVVRGYDAVLEGAPVELLHMLRIDCKRLRYGLEFFQGVLPKKVAALIPRVTALQDHLGLLHDAAVAAEMASALLAQEPAGANMAGVLVYRKARQAQVRRQIKSFPKAWRRLANAETAKTMAKLLSMA